MSHEPEHPEAEPHTEYAQPGNPDFVPSPLLETLETDHGHDQPRAEQPGMAPPVGAPARPTPEPEFKQPPATRSPAPPPPPPAGSQRQPVSSVASGAVLMAVGAAIAAGTFGLARAFAPPGAPTETAGANGQPAPPAVKAEDFKALSERVDHLKGDIDAAMKQMADRPDPSGELKAHADRLDQLARTVGELPARFDSVDQKLQTLSKTEAMDPAKVEQLDKRVDELSQAVNGLRVAGVSTGRAAPAGATAPAADANAEGMAMQQAVDLFKAGKYAEARDAFTKLQSVFPDDARVWYYSALATGFASNQWRGDTERMVNMGLDKEKAGKPDSGQVDAAFAGLTTATGKDWLAGYRKRIGAR